MTDPTTKSEPVNASHLAPVLYVPRGGRSPRMGWFRVDTPITLHHVEQSGLVPAGRQGDPHAGIGVEVRSCAGRLWLTCREGRKLAGMLAGADPDPMLQGTPWRPLTDLVPVVAGTPEESARRILWDGRGAASAEARRFAGRDLLVSDGSVLRRTRGPLYSFCASRGDTVPPGMIVYDRSYLGQDDANYVAAPHRLQAVRAAWQEGSRVRPDPARSRWGTMVTGDSGSTEDVRLMACALAQRVHESMDKALRRTEVRESARPALREAWLRLAPWRLRAEIGAIGPGETEAALREVEAGCAALTAARGAFGTGVALAYLARVAYPALSGVAPEADVEALSGLGARVG